MVHGAVGAGDCSSTRTVLRAACGVYSQQSGKHPSGTGLSRSRRELGPAQGKPRVTLRPVLDQCLELK